MNPVGLSTAGGEHTLDLSAEYERYPGGRSPCEVLSDVIRQVLGVGEVVQYHRLALIEKPVE